MLILHGSWIPARGTQADCLAVWGETSAPSRRPGRPRKARSDAARPQAHPRGATPDQLREALTSPEAGPAGEHGAVLARLPSASGLPVSPPELAVDGGLPAGESLELATWGLEALTWDAAHAPALLISLTDEAMPPECALGDDLRYWIVATRLALELLYRQRLRPTLEREGSTFLARWRPVLDEAADAERFGLLARSMPPACRALAWEAEAAPPVPRALLTSYLEAVVDALARQAGSVSAGTARPRRAPKPRSLGDAWLEALRGNPVVAGNAEELAAFHKDYRAWAEPMGSAAGADSFRLCFRLDPPPAGPSDVGVRVPRAGAREWALQYLLQATDDPSLLVPVAEAWRQRGDTARFLNRRFDHPQERLLAGLGQASRLFPPVESSLRAARPEACALTAGEAYEFMREKALLLKASGFGVLVPGLEAKLGVRVRLGRKDAGKSGGVGGLTWERVVDFDWQLALGGEPLTREEFEALARLKQPLVQVRGQWVELRPDQIEQALKFFERQVGAGEMDLSEALKLALAPDGEHGLPIVEVETAGWLGDLLVHLRRGGRREEVAEPPGFVGHLRPYQKVGVSWLATLRRYSLGACLADDMGLGKCLAPDCLVALNGRLQTAEDMWNTYARGAEFDGEGFWAVPTEPLIVNSLDESTGRMTLAPIRRLYRQQVRENLRRVELEDGNSITITRRHQLLTSRGWTNDLQIGDYVCVPARIPWDGQPVDADLVKFLAWQIAEGHELQGVARLIISQKDPGRLEALRQIILRIGQRYGLTINHPSIRTYSTKRVPELVLHSRAYQQFLDGKGYQWGRLSREKSVPSFIMQADLDSVRLFLRNYFDAEASAALSMRSVEISTASRLLVHQLALLLRRFGIWSRVSAKQKRAVNGTGIRRTYYTGVIGGNSARRFMVEIGFGNPEKQARLAEICERANNTNVEGVPASGLVAQAVKIASLPLRHFGMHNTVYVSGSQQFSRGSLARVLTGFDRILSGAAEQDYRQQAPSRWTTRTLDAYGHLDRQELSATRDRLQGLLDQEVFYCKIKAIEEVDYDGWVYDFEVAEHHNFVANNMLCHNTIQLIALLLHGKEQGIDGSPSLLVCPTSVVGNWKRELARFGPSLRVLVHHGAERKREEFAAEAARHDVVVSSYALLHRDEAELASVAWGNVVLDEAQNVKNPSTKAAQAARKLRAAWRAALTGTPVENRLSELWSIFQFLNPGYLGSQDDFRRRFANRIERVGDAAATARLKALISPFILRRVKTDRSIIDDLPEKNEMKVFCPLTREQATLYQAVVQEAMRQIEEAEGIQRRGQILAMLTKLKQVCNHPALFLHDGSPLPGRSGKLARLGEMLEEVVAVGDRALVFTQYAEMGKLLKEHLASTLGREAIFLHGGTPAAERDRMVARFQAEGRGPQVFILSIKAGGTGLNLTRANHVFHFDRWWNPAVENQATDRAFRIGQRRDVEVHKFICGGTFEEALDQLIERKVALAEAIVGAGENWITEMTTEDLRKLFALRQDAVEE